MQWKGKRIIGDLSVIFYYRIFFKTNDLQLIETMNLAICLIFVEKVSLREIIALFFIKVTASKRLLTFVLYSFYAFFLKR